MIPSATLLTLADLHVARARFGGEVVRVVGGWRLETVVSGVRVGFFAAEVA